MDHAIYIPRIAVSHHQNFFKIGHRKRQLNWVAEDEPHEWSEMDFVASLLTLLQAIGHEQESFSSNIKYILEIKQFFTSFFFQFKDKWFPMVVFSFVFSNFSFFLLYSFDIWKLFNLFFLFYCSFIVFNSIQ